ncbi:MAG: FixH family protein [Pseudomonadota bacterium]
MIQELKGRHVLLIAVTAFAIIVAANMAMLFAATGSFPGLVVKNSYVASQGWNAKTKAQQVLGWNSEVSYQDGTLTLSLSDADGHAVRDLKLRASIGRPGTDRYDQPIDFLQTAAGYRAQVALSAGIWQVRLKTLDGPAFQKTAELFIPGER